MMSRLTKLERYMKRAEVAALGSHDTETQVGAVLVNNSNGAVIADGCNGFVRGAPDGALPTTRPDKYPYMVHAETNLVANCARLGISMEDCTIVCTHSPCSNCMRLLFQSGITQVIVKQKYRDFEQLVKMKDINITESVTSEGYLILTYNQSAVQPTIG